MMLRLVVILAVNLGFSYSALASDDCFPRPDTDRVYVAKVVKSQKVMFMQADGKSSGAYVVKGDEVITFANDLNQSCAVYLSRDESMTVGLIDSRLLKTVPTNELSQAAFFGVWESLGNTVTINPGKSSDTVFIYGSAAFKENTGEISDENGAPLYVNRKGNIAEFTLVNDKYLDEQFRPLTAAKEDDGCGAKIELLSEKYLTVEDNYRCGGLNVTFTGLYLKKK